jgi:hypothetical protein
MYIFHLWRIPYKAYNIKREINQKSSRKNRYAESTEEINPNLFKIIIYHKYIYQNCLLIVHIILFRVNTDKSYLYVLTDMLVPQYDSKYIYVLTKDTWQMYLYLFL